MADNVLNLTHSKWTNLWGDLKNNISQYEHFFTHNSFNYQAPCKKIDFSIRCITIIGYLLLWSAFGAWVNYYYSEKKINKR